MSALAVSPQPTAQIAELITKIDDLFNHLGSQTFSKDDITSEAFIKKHGQIQWPDGKIIAGKAVPTGRTGFIYSSKTPDLFIFQHHRGLTTVHTVDHSDKNRVRHEQCRLTRYKGVVQEAFSATYFPRLDTWTGFNRHDQNRVSDTIDAAHKWYFS